MPSESIKTQELLKLLSYIKSSGARTPGGITRERIQAVKQVAKEIGRDNSTVADKYQRGIGVTGDVKEFDRLLSE